MFIPHGEEIRDRLLQILHAVERIPTHPFGGQLGKPALDQIKLELVGTKWRDESRMPLQPSSNLEMLVSPVIVDH